MVLLLTMAILTAPLVLGKTIILEDRIERSVSTVAGGGNITGSGSAGSLPLWATNSTLSDSRLNQSDDRLHSDLGLNFTASARGHALGLGAWVNPSNNNQVAIGEGAQANLARSTAIGYNARATAGQRNVAIGNSLVTNTDSVAIIGTASGGECVAISGICSGQRAVAIDGTAGGQNAVNIGYAGSVGGDYSHAVGMRNIVSGDYSQAFGKFLYVIGGTNITLIGQGISHGDRLIQMGSDMLQIGMASETRILMRPDGTISMGDVETSPDATVDITTLDTATVGLIVEAQSGQSANLQEWHNGTGDTALSVNKFGYLTSPTDQVTVTGSDDAGLYIASDGRASRSVVIYNATGTNYGYAGIEGSSGQTFTDSALGSFIIGSSTTRTQFAANGSIALNIGLDQTVGIFDLDPDARLDINTGLTSMIGLIVQGETGQTAHLQTWQNETEDILSYVDANGTIYMNGELVATATNGGYPGECVGGYSAGDICFNTTAGKHYGYNGTTLNALY